MTMMEGETSLKSIQWITLTTHRLIEEWSHGATTIMLEELCSCSIVRHTKPYLLGIAAIFALVGFGSSEGAFLPRLAAGPLFIGAVIFLAGYFITASRYMELASPRAVISISTSGTRLSEFKAFVQAVDAAKNDRYLLRMAGKSQTAGV